MTRLVMALVCVLSAGARAQSELQACDATAEVSSGLYRAAGLATDPTLPFDARMAGYRDLLKLHPTDLFVNRGYLANFGGYSLLPLYDSQLPRYQALLRESPSDPARRYLYAVAMGRRDPHGSIVTLEALARELPDAPWPYYALASLHRRIKPAQPAQAAANLEHFTTLCPHTLDPAALQLLADDGSDELKPKLAQRLRKELPGDKRRLALEGWPILWKLEFQLTPASGHDDVRRQLRDDIAAIRESKPGDESQRLDVIRTAYVLLNDAAGRQATEAELIRRAPESRAAADVTFEVWERQNPRPEASGPFEEQTEYSDKQWEAAKGWIERWPNYGPAFRYVYGALFIDELPANHVEALGRQIWGFIQRNPDYTLGFTDVPVAGIAEQLVNAGVALDLVPKLLDRGRADARARSVSDRAAASGPFSKEEITQLDQMSEWLLQRSEIILLVRSGDTAAAKAKLDLLQKEVNGSPTNASPFWRGIRALADAATAGGFLPVARDALLRMRAAADEEGKTATTVPAKRQLANHESSYWEARANLAAAEGRSADVAAFYWRAADTTPRDFNPAGRSRRLSLAKRAWTALGGSSEGWLAYRSDVAAASQWSAVNRKIPDFSLQDLAGKPVRLADFAGKTIFINVWATWCGPCQTEMPWVQRLFDTVKDRQDVAVLTFNIDENPGVVTQYMAEHQYRFPVALANAYVSEKMNVEGIPRNWIVDPAGTLRLERQAGSDESFVKDAIATMDRVGGK